MQQEPRHATVPLATPPAHVSFQDTFPFPSAEISPPSSRPTRLSTLTISSASRAQHTTVAHLPSPPPIDGSDWTRWSSHPQSIKVKSADLEHSLLRLLSFDVFEVFLSEEAGQRSFRKYLGASSHTLDLYCDLKALKILGDKARLAALSIRDTYLVPEGAKPAEVGAQLLKESVKALRSSMGAGDLEGPTAKLLKSLYYNEFNAYVKHRLVQHAKVRLGALELGSASTEGLGEAFCLTNPRLPDAPIVLCSPAFERITGYSKDQIIGRNCRFLQGNATAPDSVRSIREAVVHGEAITQLLLSTSDDSSQTYSITAQPNFLLADYRLDGTPFWCLLSILPLRDDKNNLVYFIGGQTNVSGMISSSTSTSLSFLLTDDTTGSAPAASQSTRTLGTDFTQEVQNQARRRSETDSDEGFFTDNPYAGPDLFHSPTPPAPEAVPLAKTETPVRPSPRRKGSGGLFGFGVKRQKTPTATTESLLSRASEKAAPLSDYVKEFALTYEKVLLLRRQGNEVLFATAQFLSSCGLPATTDVEVNSSALLQTNLLDHIVGKTTHGTKAARHELEAAIAEGRRVSVSCGMKLKEGPFSGLRRSSHSTVYGLLHLTPLVDLGTEPVAFVAVFAPDEPAAR